MSPLSRIQFCKFREKDGSQAWLESQKSEQDGMEHAFKRLLEVSAAIIEEEGCFDFRLILRPFADQFRQIWMIPDVSHERRLSRPWFSTNPEQGLIVGDPGRKADFLIRPYPVESALRGLTDPIFPFATMVLESREKLVIQGSIVIVIDWQWLLPSG